MNRLDRFRFGNLHKRRIFLLLVLVLVMVIISMLFLMFIGFFGSRAELPRIRASAELTSERTEGVGINVLEIPDANIIDNPFFGQEDSFVSAPVTDASGNYIYFDPSVAVSFHDQSLGDTVNILSIDGSGSMGLRYSGHTIGFAETMFAVPDLIEDFSALWINDPVVKAEDLSGNLYLLTETGKLISNAAINPVDESVVNPFVDICVNGINIYALTSNGEVYTATDSGPLSLYGTCSIIDGSQARFISVVNGNVVVFLSNGSIMSFPSSGSTQTGFIEADMVVTGEDIMAVSSGNDVYVSRNGIFLSQVTDIGQVMREGDSIADMEAEGDQIFILTSYGKLIRLDMSDTDINVTARDISSIEPVRICCSGPYGVIAVTTDRQAYYVSVTGGTPEPLGTTGLTVDDVMPFGADRYVIRSGTILYESSLKSAIEVDLPIADDLIIEGDICIIKSSAVETDNWDMYGDTNLVARNDGVCMIGTGDGLHAVSMLLGEPADELFERNLFYRIEITMSSDAGGNEADVWLEGDTFGTQGQHIEVTGQPKSYSYVFAVTDSMLSDESLRFNISFEGAGVINIYDVYVGLDRYDINSVPADFTDMIVSYSPAALRFDSTVPGSNGYCEDTYYGVSAFSLERELLLCKEAGSLPWIVLGSSISQNDVNNFLGYMCGSVTNEYGKMRIDNGTALPWNRQFDTIYVEIGDSDGIFPTDYQRGAYVSYVISLFEKSEFYIGVKDKIVFVDGMNYEGGTMLSNADMHASGMLIDAYMDDNGAQMPLTDAVDIAIENAMYNAPRAVSRGNDGAELVSSLRISSEYGEGEYSSADIVALILRTEYMYADIVMIDSDMADCNVIPTLRCLLNGEIMYCETLDPLDTSSAYSADQFDSACEVLLIDRNDSICLIVANHSGSMQQFTYISDAFDTSAGSYRRYSSSGVLLMERDLNSFGQRQLLQAGEYMVIEIGK